MKYCIFDLDGTILDTITTITHYVNRALGGEGLPPITEEEGKMFVGNGAYKLIERALGKYGITDEGEVARVLDIYKDMYNKEPLYLTDAFSGIRELLVRLKNEGHRLAVVSNKPHDATLPVVNHFFPGIFDAVSGAVEGIEIKPDPTLPLSVLRNMGGRPDECAFIGDTYVDMETGVNMGAALKVGVLWGFRTEEELLLSGADITVATAEELYEALRC